ncbi:MAG: hypothetical protein HIU86_04535 [Acidobacteria bacterium]|nr:hypothetical protein [Acidobacteriota bacterium]
MKMRVAASIAVTVLATTALAGCQFVTPQQTTQSYTPADGVNGSAGTVDVRNVFVLEGAGHTASVIGVLANTSDAQTSVTLQWTGTRGAETRSLVVPAGGLLSMSTIPSKIDASVSSDSSAVVLNGVAATPGALFPITFSTSDGQASLQLPVLTGSFSQYATLVPTPTPTPTRTKRTPSTGVTGSATLGAPTPTPTSTLAG